MPQTVVVVSSQLITTLSALAYLRSCQINGTDLLVLSLEKLDHMHHAHAFEEVLVRLAARDGHRCVFKESSALPQVPEALICDYLLLPRVDHKQGKALLRLCSPDVVIELGESIGVETKLYSFQARRLRHRSIRQLLESRQNLRLKYSYLVPLDQGVSQSRLQHFLDCCSDFSAMVGHELSASRFAKNFPGGAALLCLPYLKVKTWHFRAKIFGRVKGIKCSPRLKDWRYFLTRVRKYALHLKAKREAVLHLFVQVHPKNCQDLELIQKQLSRGLCSIGGIQVEVLPCDTPLELIALGIRRSSPSLNIQIAGFGTNILSAATFLHSRSHGFSLCDERAKGRIRRLWNFSFDGLVHRRELMRQRHVRKALNNLLAAMR
jgi:hypothetical protein